VLNHLGDSHLRRSAVQPLRQRHGQSVGARSRTAEDDGLRISEFWHVGLRAPGPRDATPFYEARPRIAELVWGVFALLGEFAFTEGAVGDLAQHANLVAQVANITALDLIRAAI
jgi:hypothetical protein